MLKTTRAALSKGREIAAGGEGKIYEHLKDSKKVIKLYHTDRKPSFVDHLELLASKLNNKVFVKPDEIYVDAKGNCLGFDMPYVNFNNYWLFNNLFNKGFCTSNNIDKAFKIKILKQLASSLVDLHKEGITVGDLNQYNLFVSKGGDILFVDTDSYATSVQNHNGVLLDDIRDWTTMDINDKTDIWAYDVLAFWSMTYCHPFKWVAKGNSENLEQRVRNNRSILLGNLIKDIKIPPLYDPVTGEVEKQYKEIFTGRRYIVNLDGIHVPVSTVIKQAVVSQALIIRELYDNVTSVNAATNQIAVKHNKLWSLVETNIVRVVRELETYVCDELYPSNSNFAYRTNNYLHTKSWSKEFTDPTWDYNDGSLGVIEYTGDMMWSYNINNQLGNTIECSNTSIFAKSVIKRTGNIQNLGAKKYLVYPLLNRFAMYELPDGTKDAFYNRGYVGIEYKSKNQVKFGIFQNKNSVDFDYLPNFAVNNNVVFVPENGHIVVYKAMQQIATLDCSICTRDSKLYCTTSGILLLENNILYLLNTK